MNAKQVIVALQPLTGHTITTATDDGYIEMHVAEARHLPPDERVNDGGNVILATGRVDGEGWPEGLIFWARDVMAVEWDENDVFLVGRERTCRLEIIGENNVDKH